MIINGAPGTSSKSLEIVDVMDSTFSCTKDDSFPLVVFGAIGGLIDGLPFLCGGAGGGDVQVKVPIDDCYIMDMTGEWSKNETLKEARYYAGSNSVVINDKLILSGGDSENGFLKSIEMVSPYANAIKVDVELPEGLWGHCQVQWNETTVMIIGGSTQYPFTFVPDTHFVDVYSNMIDSDGPALNTARFLHSCAELQLGTKKYIVVTGGSELKSTEILDKNALDKGWRSGKSM